ncbi:MAG: hypothetical protein J5636_06525 [Clostridiales bacterium]|nr:hypothetical protein [Clostridiales bacterium]
MKKCLVLIVSLLIASTVLFACGKSTDSDTSSDASAAETEAFEPQHKTEKETVRVDQGMIPQVIEKNVTYVQTEKDGAWEVESSEITSWGWPEDFVIVGTSWYMEAKDATKLYSGLSAAYAGNPANVYMSLDTDLYDIKTEITKDEAGTPKLDLKYNLTCDIIFECLGERMYFEDAKITGAEVYEDGTARVKLAVGDTEGILSVSADVKEITWDEFLAAIPSGEEKMKAESSTYINTISFGDLPTFNVTSKNAKDYVWDAKITNTKYGENVSPELTWDAVDGATMYVVVMIDGSWLHMEVFTDKTSLAEGEIAGKEQGDRFVGPYPPSGTHTYSVFVFALKAEMGYVELHFDAGSNSMEKIYKGLDKDKDGNEGNVIAYGRLDANYTHQD